MAGGDSPEYEETKDEEIEKIVEEGEGDVAEDKYE